MVLWYGILRDLHIDCGCFGPEDLAEHESLWRAFYRSHNGAAWAKKLGYTNVYRHPRGIKAWLEAGYPVDKVQ